MKLYEEQFNWIKEAWQETPAVVSCTVIYNLSDFPKWEDCPKDHIYVGILHKENLGPSNPDLERVDSDVLYFVKHHISGILSITCSFAEFSKTEVINPLLGLVPFGSQLCDSCNEFTTRIDNKICLDCKN